MSFIHVYGLWVMLPTGLWYNNHHVFNSYICILDSLCGFMKSCKYVMMSCGGICGEKKKPLTFIFSQHPRAFTLWQFFLKESEALNCKLYWLSQLFGWVQTWHCCSIMDETDHESSFHLIGICLTHIWPGTPRRKSLWAPVGSGWLSTVRTRIMAFLLLVCFSIAFVR